MRQDPLGADAQIEYGHHLVHQSKLNYAADTSTTVTSVVYLITTGAKRLHLQMRALFSTAGSVVVTEAPTATPSGTDIAFAPLNRSDNPAARKLLSVICKTPTGVSAGTALPAHYVQANNALMIPSVRSGTEYVLNPNTKYLVTLTLASGNASIGFEGYEE